MDGLLDDVTDTEMVEEEDVDAKESGNNSEKIREEVGQILGRMENLAWWTCSESQKQSWKVLIDQVRESIRGLQEELDRSNEENLNLLADLDLCLKELNEMKEKQTHSAGFSALPPWVADRDRNCCQKCTTAFSVFTRRHHCRSCGDIFCASCSENYVPVPHWGYDYPVRVCDKCIGATSDLNKSVGLAELVAAQQTAEPIVVISPNESTKLGSSAPLRLSFLNDIKNSSGSLKKKSKEKAPAKAVPIATQPQVSMIDELRLQMQKRRQQIQGFSPEKSTSHRKQKIVLKTVDTPAVVVLQERDENQHSNSNRAA